MDLLTKAVEAVTFREDSPSKDLVRRWLEPGHAFELETGARLDEIDRHKLFLVVSGCLASMSRQSQPVTPFFRGFLIDDILPGSTEVRRGLGRIFGDKTLSALMPTVLWAVPAEHHLKMCTDKEMLEFLYSRRVSDLAFTRNLLDIYILSSAVDKLARILCLLAGFASENCIHEPTGRECLLLALPQRTIANLSGVTIRTANRVLNQIEKTGFIALDYGMISILDAGGLLQMAQLPTEPEK